MIGTAPVLVATDSHGAARRRASFLVAGVVVLAGFVALGPYVPWLTPVAGLVLTVVLPATLLGAKLRLPGVAHGAPRRLLPWPWPSSR